MAANVSRRGKAENSPSAATPGYLTKSFSLSHQDAQNKNDRRLRIKGATG